MIFPWQVKKPKQTTGGIPYDQLEEMSSRGEAYQELIASAGWPVFEEFLKARREQLSNTLSHLEPNPNHADPATMLAFQQKECAARIKELDFILADVTETIERKEAADKALSQLKLQRSA